MNQNNDRTNKCGRSRVIDNSWTALIIICNPNTCENETFLLCRYESWGGTSDFRLPTSGFGLLTPHFGFSNLGNPFLRIICLSVSLTGSKDILLNHEETCFDLEELEMSSPRILVSGFPDKTSKIALIIYFQFYVLFNASWGQYEKCIRISGNYRNWLSPRQVASRYKSVIR